MSEYLKMLYESVMTPTPTPYAPETDATEHPTCILTVFDKDNVSLFSPRGAIISTFASQGDLDNYANSLYGLIKGANEVYSIIPELYTQAVTKFKTDKEFYEYIKDNGILHKSADEMSDEEIVYSDIIDDKDFEV